MHNPKRKAIAADLARARHLLRTRVAWTEGYPLPMTSLGLQFQSVSGERERLLVTRELLRRTRRALSTLTRGEGAPFLPELVEDPLHFEARVARVLDALAPAVHDTGTLPLELTEAASKSMPLAPPVLALLRTLSWCTGGDGTSFRLARRWVHAHARQLELAFALGATTAALVGSWQLSQHNLDPSPLLSLLALEHAHALDLSDRATRAGQLKALALHVPAGKLQLDDLSEAHQPEPLAPALEAWLLCLVQRPLPLAKRALTLLQLLELPDLLAERSAALAQLARAEQRLTQWAVAGKRVPPEVSHALHAELAMLEREGLHTFNVGALFERIDSVAGFDRAVYERITQLLELLPSSYEGVPIRLRFLAYLEQCQRALGKRARHWFAVLEAHLELAQGVTLLRWLGPVNAALSVGRRGGLHFNHRSLAEETSEMIAKGADPQDFALAWGELLSHDRRPSSDELELLFHLTFLVRDPSRGLALFLVLPPSLRDETYAPWPALVALADAEPSSLAELLSLLAPDGVLRVEGLNVLYELFERARALPLLRRVIHDMPRRVLTLARHLSRLHDLRKTLPLPRMPGEDAAPPAWSERYPSELYPALARLEHSEDAAEEVAARILGDTFPDRARLKEELKNLGERRKQAEPALQSRLDARREALRRRLRERPSASTRKLENLRQKLLDRADRSAFEAWLRATDARLRSLGLRKLGLADVTLPEDFAITTLLVALGELPDDTRALARELLTRRAGPPPWDLRERGENQAFLARLAARGIDMTAWLDPELLLVKRDEQGHEVRLSFARDPLDVLRMGEHFDTCLSPFGMNFFSAVSNAADVNKRVLYAHRDGSVWGRCLFALTAEGAIVTFEPYCHAGQSFAAMVAEVALGLAAKMGTVVLPRGEVPCLVAKRWYDDGTRDLARSFPALEEGSELQKTLVTLPLDRLVETLHEACAPVGLGSMTLPIVLHLTEFDRRPELILPLLPLILPGPPMQTFETRQRILSLLAQAGRADLLPRLCSEEDLERFVRYPYLGGPVELLIAESPTRVLAALRRTRERGVRKPADEGHARLWWTILCLLHLKRRNQARQLFAVLTGSAHFELAPEQRARYQELLEQA